LYLFVLDEQAHGLGYGPDIILWPRFNLAPRQLVLELPLNFFGLSPRARPGLLPVLLAFLGPAEVLPAIAATREFITRVFASGRVPDKDRKNWRCAHLTAPPVLMAKTTVAQI
jgi:hypothetical protein